MDLMKHQSSAVLAMCGRTSLNHCPDSPCWANLKGDPNAAKRFWLRVIKVTRCVPKIDWGMSLPFSSFNLGL